jgi:hypothetical protein
MGTLSCAAGYTAAVPYRAGPWMVQAGLPPVILRWLGKAAGKALGTGRPALRVLWGHAKLPSMSLTKGPRQADAGRNAK